jgi:hypothetical protein
MKVTDLLPWLDMKGAITRTLLRDWPEMDSWLNGFFSHNIRDLVTKTVALDPQDSYTLIQEILWNCYKASTFKDPHEPIRKLGSEFLEDRRQARPAIKKLRDLLKKYPSQTGWIVARANAFCRTRSPDGHARFVYMGNQPISFAQAFDQFLASLDESFQWHVPGVKNGSFLHRFQAGTHQCRQPVGPVLVLLPNMRRSYSPIRQLMIVSSKNGSHT